MNWITITTYLPLLGAVALLLHGMFWSGKREQERLDNEYRWLTLLITLVTFVASIPILLNFNSAQAGPQMVTKQSWITSFGVSYHTGVDGLSIWLVLLTTFLMPISILASWHVHKRVREYMIFLLILETGMLGVFVALDMFLFYLFFEITLIPMYFLIGVWGSDRRLYAAIKFFLYTLAGSVLMLLAVLAIYFQHAWLYHSGAPAPCPADSMFAAHTAYTFDYQVLALVTPHFTGTMQWWLFWGFFFAFAIKVPMFPFHTWLPDAHTEAPTAGSVILAGVLLKMGTYGFLRFSVPMLPQGANDNAWIMIVLSIIAIIYGALVCMMQKDMKKLIAYSSVSHMGFCTLGIFALTPMGVSGSILQQLNHGISTGALFLIVGVLYERRHTRLISEFGGLATPMPNFAAMYLIISLSSLGMPLLNGFIGEFAILRGVFEVDKTWAAWGAAGIVLGAAYLLWLYQRVMFGPITNPENKSLPDLNGREWACLLPLVALAFWIGIYPAPFFRYLDPPARIVVEKVNPSYYHVERARAAKPAPAAAAGNAAAPAAAPAAQAAGGTQ